MKQKNVAEDVSTPFDETIDQSARDQLALNRGAAKKKNGFTLIEIGIAILIIAILTTAFLVGTQSSLQNANTAALKNHIMRLVSVAHSYGGVNAGNPNGVYARLPTGPGQVNVAGSPPSNPYVPTPWPSPNSFNGFGYFIYGPNNSSFGIVENGTFSAAIASTICSSLISHTYNNNNGNGCSTATGGSITLYFQ